MGKSKIHFVGIGGFSMSGLAFALAKLGYIVTGSDIRLNSRIAWLKENGIVINIGHDPALIQGVDVVVYNTEIPKNNIELVAAYSSGIKVIHRSEVLAWFMNRGKSIAVSGSHGKTTTTGMIAYILMAAGFDPTVLIGGESSSFKGTARLGEGQYVVAEVDDSDGSFLLCYPNVTVLTNFEPEHLEYYNYSISRLTTAYKQFITQLSPDGLLIACADNQLSLEIAREQIIQKGGSNVVLFGVSEEADWRAYNIENRLSGSKFKVLKNNKSIGEVHLKVPGKHNVINSLAALAIGDYLGLSFKAMSNYLSEFRNCERRLQLISDSKDIMVVDDYCHHPTEIRTALITVRETMDLRPLNSRGKIIGIFSPRSYVLSPEELISFVNAFDEVDLLIIKNIRLLVEGALFHDVTEERLVQQFVSHGKEIKLLENDIEIIDFVKGNLRTNDLVITMGAEDMGELANKLIKSL